MKRAAEATKIKINTSLHLFSTFSECGLAKATINNGMTSKKTHSSTQCPAVATQYSLTRAPPHR